MKSNLEDTLCWELKALGFPPFEPQYRFSKLRKWRFDLAWPKHKIAAEIEGGIYVYGRHNRPKGFRDDCEKYNEAQRLGWRVFRFTADMLKSGQAREILEDVLR